MRRILFLAGVVVLLGMPLAGLADVATSTNFTVDTGLVPAGGGYATSSGFNLRSTIGQPVTGISSSTNFILRGGFLNFPAILAPRSEKTATTSLTAVIGGDFTFTNASASSSVTFSAPSGFYTEDVVLNVAAYATTTYVAYRPPPSGKDFVGQVYDFTLQTVSLSAPVATTTKSITITLGYLSSDISGFNESTLAPYRREGNSTVWTLISGSTLNTTNRTITFATDSFSSFSLLAAPSTSPPPPPPPPPPPSPPPSPPSGGGGGGGGYAPATTVTFKGLAYPKSTVTLLKDAQVAAAVPAGPDARFEIQLSGLSAGSYNFAVYAEDRDGNRSVSQNFTISVTPGVTTVISGIFIAPFMSLDKTEVKKGDVITFFGSSAPTAQVAVAVNSDEEILLRTTSTEDGTWVYKFDTDPLDYGDHTAKARAVKNADITAFSRTRSFVVGNKNIFATRAPKCPPQGDLNHDCRVNLIDFSILAYWYRRANVPVGIDINGDGKIDLIDFSIMAYYWTG